jgi:hypothetical protein
MAGFVGVRAVSKKAHRRNVEGRKKGGYSNRKWGEWAGWGEWA